MKPVAALSVVSALVVSALAQQNSTLIPSDISQPCSAFLNKLNNDNGVATCLNRIIEATDAFDPNTGSTSVNATVVSNTLNNICSTSFQSCSSSTIRTWIADFYSSCSNELLQTKQETVIAMYDVLYLVVPLKDAICSRDTNGKYCVQEITITGSGSSTTTAANPAATTHAAKREPSPQGGPVVDAETIELLKSTSPYKYASNEDNDFAFGIPPNVKRQDNTNNQSPLNNLPNAELYYNTSLPYLFINPNYSLTDLCKTCTQQVIGAYVKFESITPYALGIGNSPILQGQLALWQKLKECPDGFVTSILDSSMPDRIDASGASRSVLSVALSTVVIGFVSVMML